jgi:phage-related protein
VAVVGSAKIIVRAITDQVEGDIRRGFRGSDRVGSKAGREIGDAMRKGINAGGGNINFFSRVSNGLKMMGRDSRGAYAAFAQLQRKFYTISTLLSGLIGGIFSLGGAIAALGGTVLGAAPSFLALANAMIAFKLAGSVIGMAFKGVGAAVSALTAKQTGLAKSTADIRKEMKQLAFDAEAAALGERRASLSLEEAREALAMAQDLPPNSRVRREAELAYAEAELNMRRAMDQNKNAQEALEKGPDTSQGGGGAVASAMEGLNKYQKAFARFLAGLKPKIDQLRLTISRNLLPPLQTAIQTLVNKAFPTLEKGLGQIAAAVGAAAIAFVDIATKSGVLEAVGRIFSGQSKFIEKFGTVLGNVFEIFVILLDASLPLLEQFADFLIDSTAYIRDWLTEMGKSGEMAEFFDNAGRIAGILGDIFGNVFSALGSFISAAIGPGSPGEYLLTWIAEVTQGWADAMSTDGAKDGINESLQIAAENAQKFLQLIGGIFGAIASGLNTPNLGAFFDAISAALPSLQGMFEEAGSALPIMGELIANVLRFLGAFTESGAITVFFDIINAAATLLADIMENEVVQSIIKFAAPIHAISLGFGYLAETAGKAMDVVKDGLARVGEGMDFLAANPVLGVLIALAAIFVYLYETNEEFRASMDALFAEMKAVAIPIIEELGDKFGAMFASLAPAIATIFPVFLEFFTAIGDAVIALLPAFGMLASAFGDIIGVMIDLVIAVLPPLMEVFKALIPIIPAIVSVVLSLADVFADMVASVLPPLTAMILTLADILPAVIGSLLPVITALLPIIPILGGIIVTLSEAMLPLIEQVLPILAQLIMDLAPVFIMLIEQIAPLLPMLIDALVPILIILADLIGQHLPGMINAVLPVIVFLIGAFSNVVKFVTGQLVPIFMRIIDAVKMVIGWFGGIAKAFIGGWAGITAWFKGFVNTIIGYFQNFVNFVIRGLNSFFAPLRNSINGILQALGVRFQFSIIPQVTLPRLAKGGIVMPSAGGSIVNIAEAGKPEKVVPLDSQGFSKGDRAVIEAVKGGGMGGPQIIMNIQASEGMDVRDLADEVSRRLAFTMRKGAIA